MMPAGVPPATAPVGPASQTYPFFPHCHFTPVFMKLCAVVYAEELTEQGRSVVLFNIKTPKPNFAHFAVPNHRSGDPARTVAVLLAQVQQQHPTARHEFDGSSSWIVTD